MRWSRNQQRTALKLHAIEQARHKAAEARLAAANAAVSDAEADRLDAERAVGDAATSWERQLDSRAFNLDLGQVFAAQLLRTESGLRQCEDRKTELDGQAKAEREAWRHLEASVRSGERTLRSGRRILARRAAESIDRELADRTTWKWFRG